MCLVSEYVCVVIVNRSRETVYETVLIIYVRNMNENLN